MRINFFVRNPGTPLLVILYMVGTVFNRIPTGPTAICNPTRQSNTGINKKKKLSNEQIPGDEEGG